MAWGWRWLLGLAATAAVFVLILLPLLSSAPQPQIQLAMLDVAGLTRGGDTNEAVALAEAWKSTSVTNFSSPQALKSWEEEWGNSTKGYQVKVVYNKAAAELVVLGKGRGREFKKSFSVDSGLQQALVEAQRFIVEETKK